MGLFKIHTSQTEDQKQKAMLPRKERKLRRALESALDNKENDLMDAEERLLDMQTNYDNYMVSQVVSQRIAIYNIKQDIEFLKAEISAQFD